VVAFPSVVPGYKSERIYGEKVMRNGLLCSRSMINVEWIKKGIRSASGI